MTPYLNDGDVRLAWAAGLFEGEGCISTGGAGGIVIHLSSSDRDVVERFANTVGHPKISSRKKGETWKSHWKDQWQWSASGASAERIIGLLLPYLGERRTSRALEVMANRRRFVADATRERDCPGCGIRFQPKMSPRARRQTHCSEACYGRQRSFENRVERPPRKCGWCGQDLALDAWPTRRYCSATHRTYAYRRRVKV